MKTIILLLTICTLCSCLNRDNLAPYQTGLSPETDKSKTIQQEKSKIEEITKNLKTKGASNTEAMYSEMSVAFNSWIDSFALACKEDNITNNEYQNSLVACEKKYTKFIEFAKENMPKTDMEKIDVAETTYRYEVYAKRLFNKHRNEDTKTQELIIEKIYQYKLAPFDKL